MNGIIFDIKEMAVHDGPGIRTTVFFKGCPLRCHWCHNPEGLLRSKQIMFKEAKCIGCNSCKIKCSHPECQDIGRCIYMCPENCLEIVGREVDAKTLASELRTSASILGSTFGGFTFSGGEPLAQSDFLIELANNLSDYNLAIETSGYAEQDIFLRILDVIDYVIMDIKIADPKLHKKYTGVENNFITENLKVLKESRKPHLIRTPLIPGITDTEENLSQIENLVTDSPWEKLPYNPMAGAKYKMLGMNYPLG